jgi:hypothetical protein
MVRSAHRDSDPGDLQLPVIESAVVSFPLASILNPPYPIFGFVWDSRRMLWNLIPLILLLDLPGTLISNYDMHPQILLLSLPGIVSSYVLDPNFDLIILLEFPLSVALWRLNPVCFRLNLDLTSVA